MTVRIGGVGGSSAAVLAILQRRTEWRVIPDEAVNDGTQLSRNPNTHARFQHATPALDGGFYSLGGAGSELPILRLVDNRRGILFQPTNLNFRTNLAFRNFAPPPSVSLLPADLRPTFGATTSGVDTSQVPPLWRFSIMGWCRKNAGGDASHSRFTFGFGNNRLLNPSMPVARFGLIGDGVTGYRFGSVNCPIAPALGNNGPADIDPGAVQPAELVNPGTNWFHVWIRTTPPTPTTDGFWEAILNGTPVARFTSPNNFAQGSGAVDDQFTWQEATVYNFGDAGVIIPGLIVSDLVFIAEEL